MNIKPQGNNLLIEHIKTRSVTDSGIRLPDEVLARICVSFGRVLAKGPGLILQSGEYAEIKINVGDIVMFQAGAQVAPVEFDSIFKAQHGIQTKKGIMNVASVMAVVDMSDQELKDLIEEPESKPDVITPTRGLVLPDGSAA